ncbi:hypothetical protein Bbad01_39510 [Bacillus badius]|nr:hypothetical protein Bbad01_39510 [Bacillus badius]
MDFSVFKIDNKFPYLFFQSSKVAIFNSSLTSIHKGEISSNEFPSGSLK